MTALTRSPITGNAERIEPDDTLKPEDADMGRWFWLRVPADDTVEVEDDELEDDPDDAFDSEPEDEDDEEEGEAPEEPAKEVLACVTHVGSNYAELTGVKTSKNSQPYWRIHFNEWHRVTRRELDPDKVIDAEVRKRQTRVAQLMGQVQEITHALGLANAAKALPPAASTSTALARFSSARVDEYKTALVKAKQTELPALFKEIENTSTAMGLWMEAKLIPIHAYATGLKPVVKRVEDRIFQVELYAGLTEQVVQIKEGRPAREHTPIHLWQRRCYMDEECLIDYETGGMTFANIEAFDAWLCRPEHLKRILPMERSIVAFQVRRSEKERGFDSLSSFLAFQFSREAERDRLTYLYIRNGEQVFRLNTAIDFGEQLFPDMEHQVLSTSEQLWAKRDGGGWRYHLITQGALEQMRAAEQAADKQADADYARRLIEHGHQIAKTVKKWEQYELAMTAYRAAKKDWKVAHAAWRVKLADWQKRSEELKERTKKPTRFDPRTGTQYYWWESLHDTEPRPVCPSEPREPSQPARPLRRNSDDGYSYRWRPSRVTARPESEGYKPFNRENVEYDDIQASVQAQIDQHNRLVLVLQGLLDRSPVLMPHPAWKLYEPAGFTAALTLVYDQGRALVDGPAPDFGALRDMLNEKIKPGTLCVGQQDYWLRHEAQKYNRRSANGRQSRLTHYRPEGNPGPGRFARVAKVRTVKGVRCAIFKWQRRAQRRASRWDAWGKNPLVECSVAVPLTAVFNADAYEPGSYHQFFDDPRTRCDYLRWAPVLLLSEEWKAGNIYVGSTREATNCRGELKPKPPKKREPAHEEIPEATSWRAHKETTCIEYAEPVVSFDPDFGGGDGNEDED